MKGAAEKQAPKQKAAVSNQANREWGMAAVSYLENADTMGERTGRIRRIETDFFIRIHEF